MSDKNWTIMENEKQPKSFYEKDVNVGEVIKIFFIFLTIVGLWSVANYYATGKNDPKNRNNHQIAVGKIYIDYRDSIKDVGLDTMTLITREDTLEYWQMEHLIYDITCRRDSVISDLFKENKNDKNKFRPGFGGKAF